MNYRRIYANPPLAEALCEFRFRSNQEWDWTIPGLLYAGLKDLFPKKQQTEHVSFQWREDLTEVQRRTAQRLRFSTEDETSLVQVGANLLVLNILKPYPGWERFRAMVALVLERYAEVARPQGLSAVALRFINRIDIPREGAILDDYLRAVPVIPENLPQSLAGWTLSLDIPFEAPEGIINLQSGSAISETGDAAFILDLQFRAVRADSLELGESLLSWIDSAHQVIEDTFEASITEKARSIFQEEFSHDQLPAR